MPVLILVIVLGSMGFGLVLPPFMFAAENLGASPAIAATIAATFSVGQFIATPIWGRLSDRHGRKPILMATMAGSGLAYLLMAFAESLWVLVLARFLTGLLAGNFAAAMAYVTDITTEDKRAQGMGMVGGAVSLGFMLGPAIGGLLGGTSADTASLYAPGLVAALASFLTMFAVIFFLKESLPPEKRVKPGDKTDEGESANGGGSALLEVLRRPVIAQMVLMGFLVFFAMAMFETIFPLWAGERFEWGPREVGLSFTFLGVVVMITQVFLVGRLAPRFGEGKVLIGAVSAYAFGLLVMTQMPTWPLMLVGITFTAAGGALFNTSATSWVSKHAGEQERGMVIGTYQSGTWLGRSIGPTFSGLLFQGAWGANAPLFGGALVMALSVFLVMRVRRTSARLEAEG